MKATKILEWIVRESIEGEDISFVDVPNEGDHEWEQNEDWWLNMFGSTPTAPIAAGKYLYYYQSAICDTIYCGGAYHVPDAQIEISTCDGFDYIYLYKVED